MVLFLTEYFRANGLGHLRRCIAFSELFIRNGIKTQIVVNTDHSDADIFNSDLKQQNWMIENHLDDQYEAIIIDSYRAQLKDYEHFQHYTNRLVAIDDDKRIDYPLGCIIYNGGLGGLVFQYDQERYKKVLVGPEFALLRKEFRENCEDKKLNERIEKILITMGGSDPLQLTATLLQYYTSQYPSIYLDVIIGPGFTDFREINYNHFPCIKFYKNLDARVMCKLMLQADLCITAGGQTIYELGSLGVPFIVLKTAENQNGNLTGLVKSGAIDTYLDPNEGDFLKNLHLVNLKLENQFDRQNMSTKLKSLFQIDSLDIVGSILN